MIKKKVELYYVLRKRNAKEKDPDGVLAYQYIHEKLWWRDTKYDIGAAKLFKSKEEAQTYKDTHKTATNYEIFEVDPREICLSTTSCDDCSWGGACPRHPN